MRFLAPVALVAFGVAVLMLVSSFKGQGSTGRPSAAEQAKQQDLGSQGKKPRKPRNANGKLPTKFYTVKTGDTLGSIAEKTGIPVQKLQELNPQVDPQQLGSGQRLKLRE